MRAPAGRTGDRSTWLHHHHRHEDQPDGRATASHGYTTTTTDMKVSARRTDDRSTWIHHHRHHRHHHRHEDQPDGRTTAPRGYTTTDTTDTTTDMRAPAGRTDDRSTWIHHRHHHRHHREVCQMDHHQPDRPPPGAQHSRVYIIRYSNICICKNIIYYISIFVNKS